MNTLLRITLIMSLTMPLGCGKEANNTPPKAQPNQGTAPTNRLSVPQSVRQNLSITFAKAQLRSVDQTLRLPGRFQLKPTAVRSYPALLPGPVELNVRLFQHVSKGDLLAQVYAPDLQHRQHALHEADNAIEKAQEAVRLARAKLKAGQVEVTSIRRRLKQLGGAQVRRADLEADRDRAVASLAVLKAQLKSTMANVVRERHHKDEQLRALSRLTKLSVKQLTQKVEPTDDSEDELMLLCMTMTSLEVRAQQDGIVSHIGVTQGEWATLGATVMTVTDNTNLQYVATALQSDLNRLKDGQNVTLVDEHNNTAKGTLRMGVAADRHAHGFPVMVTLEAPVPWAKPNLRAFADVVIDASSEPEIAVPKAAIVRDGLNMVFFRRDPNDPDSVIRVVAELGIANDRWSTVFSGINAGDEVVVDGAYELVLASTAKPTIKGHFHPDGTFHAEQ